MLEIYYWLNFFFKCTKNFHWCKYHPSGHIIFCLAVFFFFFTLKRKRMKMTKEEKSQLIKVFSTNFISLKSFVKVRKLRVRIRKGNKVKAKVWLTLASLITFWRRRRRVSVTRDDGYHLRWRDTGYSFDDKTRSLLF